MFNPLWAAGIFLGRKFISSCCTSIKYKWVPVRVISQCIVAAHCAMLVVGFNPMIRGLVVKSAEHVPSM